MSVLTWKKEFCPEIRFLDELCAKENMLKAAEHSLKKWQGLLPENLEKHKVKFDGSFLEDVVPTIEIFQVTGEYSCALCRWSREQNIVEEWSRHKCDYCPLFKYCQNKQGGFSTDDNMGCVPSYAEALKSKVLTGMIEDLQGTVDAIKAGTIKHLEIED